jgi:hypothetical protein
MWPTWRPSSSFLARLSRAVVVAVVVAVAEPPPASTLPLAATGCTDRAVAVADPRSALVSSRALAEMVVTGQSSSRPTSDLNYKEKHMASKKNDSAPAEAPAEGDKTWADFTTQERIEADDSVPVAEHLLVDGEPESPPETPAPEPTPES